MFKPLSLFIALRYLRAKKRNHFVSFISLISTTGIALGVTVLITVLSVMNGFDNIIKTRIFGVARQVTITGPTGVLNNWQSLQLSIKNNKKIVSIAPYVDGQGLLTTEEGAIHPVQIVGIDPQAESQLSSFSNHMIKGQLFNLKPQQFNIILGEKLAALLGVTINDKILVMVPKATLTPAGMLPQYRSFTVAGIFSVGNGFAFDSQLALVEYTDAQKLLQMGDMVSGLRLKLTDLYEAQNVSNTLQKALGENYIIRNWTEEYGSFFETISLEKTMMFILLTLIIAVATFNLVSTLVMVVNDKRTDIAILRTLGSPPKQILTIFLLQGIIIGVVGTTLGLGGGILLASHITHIVQGIEKLFHLQLLSASIYFVNYLPSKILMSDLLKICSISLLMSSLATLYPALQAARTDPAEALRYE